MEEKGKKGLSLLDALGLKELYIPEGETVLTVEKSVFIPSIGKMEWIESKLPLWQETLLNSGALEVAITLKPPDFPIKRGKFGGVRPSLHQAGFMGKILITLKLPGSLITNGTSIQMTNAILRAVNSNISDTIHTHFPPPFDPFNPLLPANTEDFLMIRGRKLYEGSCEAFVYGIIEIGRA